MSTVRRIIWLSPVEPAPLSLRTPASMETRIETTMLRQNGAPYNQDPAAQLQLTARTSGLTTSYAMPSTDVVNGKARAVVPAGDLDDINGYRLRILGTIDQQPALIAMGHLRLVEAAGMDAVPDDVVDTIAITLTRNYPASIDVELWHDAGKTNPYDLTGSTVTALILTTAGGTTLVPFTVASIGPSAVNLSLTDVQVNALPGTAWWTLTVSAAAGQKLLAQGPVTVIG